MVRDAHNALTDETGPRMLRQPADAPPPLGPVSATDGVATFRRVLADRSAAPASLRAWAGRVSGRSDRRLVLALAGATEAIASHCDQLVARLAAQEAVKADVASSFGQEIAQLRAEVVRLQRSVDALRRSES
jgi:uncharacterized protein YceH (UPF0502 family)